MGQHSLIFLVYSSSDHRAAFVLFFSLYFKNVFSTHSFFELRSAAHIDTFLRLPCVKTVWIEVEGAL